MKSVKLRAPAKINLTLDVLEKRPDGYHNMEMVMQSISLCNTVTVGLSGTQETYLYCNNSDVPDDEHNLAWKAARRFFEHTGLPERGLVIGLEKNVPMEAGLAGGSADAAAALVGLNVLCGANLSTEQLCEIGVLVGADVPFCIAGGTMLSRGVGEVLTPLAPLPECFIVVAKPHESMKTAECFARYGEMHITKRPDTKAMEQAVAAQDLRRIGAYLCNVFEEVTSFESVTRLRERLLECGALGACMTGSGTAVFGIFADKRHAKRAYSNLMSISKSVFLASPVRFGASVLETA